MSHGSGEDGVGNVSADPTREAASPAHAAPDPEPEVMSASDAEPEIELDAGLAIAAEPEQFPPGPIETQPSDAQPVGTQQFNTGPVRTEPVLEAFAAPAAPVQYPVPPQNYGPPSYEEPTFQPQNYQQPTYEQPTYQPPTYEQPSYQQPSYQQPSYEQPNYQRPSYQQPSYEQPNYQPPTYEQPTYQPQNYPQQDLQAPAQQARHADPGPPKPTQDQPSAHTTPPPLPPPIPRPEDLLVPNRSPVTAEPASWGWRGKLSRGTGGLFKPKATPDELVARQAIADIQRSFSRPKTVVVIQPKGGAGKTPTAICLSAAFGAHRGGYVVGWDDNETRGTLAVRVSNPDDQRATAWDLLSDLAAFERFDARVGDLSYYVRSQPDAHFDALVSDDNPANMAQIGEDEYQRLHKVLQRFYRMIVVDTGNNVRSPNWQAAVNSADLVVVVSTYQRDVGYSGSWVLDHLAQTGREELARNAVTVLTAADPTTDKIVRTQLIPHFEARTRAVAEIPYDPELAHGGPIRWTALDEGTRNAWVAAGATIVNALVEQDRRELAARRG